MTIKMNELVVDSSILSEKLGGDGYSNGEILMILYENCPQFCEQLKRGKVKKLIFNDINNGQGYLSYIYKTTIEFEHECEKPFNLILKVPNGDIFLKNTNSEEQALEVMRKTHAIECDFYQLIHPFNVDFAPHVYYCEKMSKTRPGLIVMEDLSSECVTFGMIRSGTVEQFWNVAQKLARFQATIACCLPQDAWVEKFRDDYHTTSFHSNLFKPMVQQTIGYDKNLKKQADRMLKVLSPKYSKYSLVDRPTELNALTLCHGDLWTNNILFSKNSDGSVSNNPLRFIDYQLAFSGNLFFDLARHLTVGYDAEIRREIQVDLVGKYFKMLKEEYWNLSGGQVEVPFTLEQATELFELAFVEQTAVTMILVPFIQSDARHSNPRVLKAKLDKLLLRCRLCVEDALEIVERRGLDKRFA